MGKKIALLLGKAEVQNMLPAVLDYAAEAGWREVSIIPFPLGYQGLFPQTDFDGAILKISNAEILQKAQRMNCPVVNISQAIPAPDFPQCTYDNHEVGVLAARHLIACGARNFGVVLSHNEFAEYRRKGFSDELARQGHILNPDHVLYIEQLTEAKTRRLLKSWPCCFGLFTDADDYGKQAIILLEKLGRHIPNEIAVVSCNNRMDVCTTCTPPLSSVELPEAEVGTTACALLERLMRGKKNVPWKTIVKPVCIAIRSSSAVQMTEDTQVTAALQILKTSRGLRLNADELAQSLSMTRRTLDRRFYRYVGHSAADHIRQLRLERAQTELCSHEHTIAEIAIDVGYQSATHLSKVLLKATGKLPSDFRRARPQPDES
jgi:LacI family transcriptional regulator